MPRELRQPRALSQSEREGIEKVLRADLSARQEILFGYVLGSFVEGEAARDIDLGVWVEWEDRERATFREYENELSVNLSIRAGFPVDVRALNDAPVAFRYHALKGRALVVRDSDVLDEFKARTWDDYIDFAPFARKYLHEVFGG